jgi:hypothetical protein
MARRCSLKIVDPDGKDFFYQPFAITRRVAAEPISYQASMNLMSSRSMARLGSAVA